MIGVGKVSINEGLEPSQLNTLGWDKAVSKVSKIHRLGIRFFYEIYAFFTTLIYGPWQGFWQNIKEMVQEKTTKKVLNLYQQYKSSKPQRSDNEIAGYKFSSEEATNRLKQKQGKKNLGQYQVFGVELTSEEAEILKPFLDKIENENSNINTSNILISLNTLLDNPNVPTNIKNLLKGMLKKIPEGKKLIETSNPKVSKPQDSPPSQSKPIVLTNPNQPITSQSIDDQDSLDGKNKSQTSKISNLHKIAIVSATTLSLFAIVGIYYYFNKIKAENIDSGEETPFENTHSFLQSSEYLSSNITNLFCETTTNIFSYFLPLPFQRETNPKEIPSQFWNFFFARADEQTQDITFIPSIIRRFL